MNIVKKHTLLLSLMLLMVSVILIFSAYRPVVPAESSGISSVTEWVTVFEDGKETTYKDEYKAYNKMGKPLMKINYRKDGTISEKEVWKYDSFGNRIEKIYYQEVKAHKAETVRDHKTFKYNAYRDKIETIEYNNDGTVKEKTLLSYNADGKLETESVYHPEGKLKKRVMHRYNKMKKVEQKLTLSAKGDTLKLQKYIYELF